MTYSIADGQGGTATAALALGPVSPVNDNPVGVNDTVALNEDAVASGNVLTNDTDVDGNPLTVTQFTVNGIVYTAGSSVVLPEGTLTITSTGAFTFTPAANYNGSVPTAIYTLSDGAGGTATAALTIGPIAAVNDAPVAANDTIAVTENFAGTGNVLGNDSDLDGDGLFVTQFVVNGITYAAGTTASFAEGVLVIGSDGAVTFNPALDYNGPVPAGDVYHQ